MDERGRCRPFRPVVLGPLWLLVAVAAAYCPLGAGFFLRGFARSMWVFVTATADAPLSRMCSSVQAGQGRTGSAGHVAAVHDEYLPRDVTGGIAGQEDRGVRDLLGPAPASHRHVAQHLLFTAV